MTAQYCSVLLRETVVSILKRRFIEMLQCLLGFHVSANWIDLRSVQVYKEATKSYWLRILLDWHVLSCKSLNQNDIRKAGKDGMYRFQVFASRQAGLGDRDLVDGHGHGATRSSQRIILRLRSPQTLENVGNM